MFLFKLLADMRPMVRAKTRSVVVRRITDIVARVDGLVLLGAAASASKDKTPRG